MKHRAGSVLFTILLAVAGCKQPHTSEPAPAQAHGQGCATPLSEKKDELGTENAWTQAWYAYIETNLPPEMLSAKAAKAIESSCPAYLAASEVDKRAFWAYTDAGHGSRQRRPETRGKRPPHPGRRRENG